MEGEETITVRLPAEISITYEFRNPFKSEKETPTKFSVNVRIFLTREETEALDEELTNLMIRALNVIFEARRLEATEKATEEVAEEIFDTDPA